MIKSTLNYSKNLVPKVVLDYERKKALKEPETYRLVLESLRSATRKRVLTTAEVSRLMGRTRPWCKKQFEIGKDGITVEALAWKMAETLS